MAQRPGFIMPHDIYLEEGSRMTPEEKAAMYDAVNLYSINGAMPAFDDRYLMAIFNRYKACIDAGAGKYKRKCEQLEDARKNRERNKSASLLNQSESTLNQKDTSTNKIKSNQNKSNKPEEPDEPDELRWWD